MQTVSLTPRYQEQGAKLHFIRYGKTTLISYHFWHLMVIAFELGYDSARFHVINARHPFFWVNPQELLNLGWQSPLG